jgi:urease accessory protein
MVTYVRVLLPPAREGGEPAEIIRLDHEARRKTRQRVVTESGAPAALLLARGTVLRHGDRVAAEDGQAAGIVAADEALSAVRCDDPVRLARVAYHLGNRHAPVMLVPGSVLYPADRVLDDMVRSLGLMPESVCAPFEPELGAYSLIFDAAVGAVGGPWIP